MLQETTELEELIQGLMSDTGPWSDVGAQNTWVQAKEGSSSNG